MSLSEMTDDLSIDDRDFYHDAAGAYDLKTRPPTLQLQRGFVIIKVWLHGLITDARLEAEAKSLRHRMEQLTKPEPKGWPQRVSYDH